MTPKELAEQIVSVQPIHTNIEDFFNSGMIEEQLLRERYKPISTLNLLYIKDDVKNED